MAKEFNIQDYINSLKLSDEEKKVVEAIFAKEENVAEVKRGWNSVSEGSRLADEARAAAQTAAAEKAEADRLKAEAATELEKSRVWNAKMKEYEGNVQQTQAERDALAAEKLAYEQYLESIGVEPSFALSGKQPIKPAATPPPPVKADEPPAPAGDPEFLKRYETFQKQATGAVELLADLPFAIDEVHQRHIALYGKPAPNMMELKAKYLNPQNTRTLMDIAAEDFHFADRQKELDEQALNTRAEQLATEKFEKRMSELHLPSTVIEQIRDSVPVKFASEDFSKNTSRAGEVSAATVPDKDMEAFLQLDAELAAQGIRPGL